MEKSLPSYRLPLEDLLKQFADATLAPGGVAVCAVQGAMGAALVSQVGRLTANREDCEPVKEEMMRVANRAEYLTGLLQGAIDQEIQAHNRLTQAHTLSQATSEEQKIRTDCIQVALKNGVQVPLSVAQSSLEALQLCETVLRYGYSGLKPDAASAAMAITAAIHGSALMIRQSLSLIGDVEWCKSILEKLAKTLQQADDIERDITPLYS